MAAPGREQVLTNSDQDLRADEASALQRRSGRLASPKYWRTSGRASSETVQPRGRARRTRSAVLAEGLDSERDRIYAPYAKRLFEIRGEEAERRNRRCWSPRASAKSWLRAKVVPAEATLAAWPWRGKDVSHRRPMSSGIQRSARGSGRAPMCGGVGARPTPPGEEPLSPLAGEEGGE